MRTINILKIEIYMIMIFLIKLINNINNYFIEIIYYQVYEVFNMYNKNTVVNLMKNNIIVNKNMEIDI